MSSTTQQIQPYLLSRQPYETDLTKIAPARWTLLRGAISIEKSDASVDAWEPPLTNMQSGVTAKYIPASHSQPSGDSGS